MTYRTLLRLHPDNHLTRSILADRHTAHVTVMQGFTHLIDTTDHFTGADGNHPDHRAALNILHAVDVRRANNEVRLMVQSDQPGHWEANNLTAALITPPRTVEYTPPANGSVNYRLTYNPTIKTGGKRRPLTRPEAVLEWFTTRADSYGLRLDGQPQLLATEAAHNGKHNFRLSTATIQGAATITDAQAFTTASRQGVGRAKAYGCGLLMCLPR